MPKDLFHPYCPSEDEAELLEYVTALAEQVSPDIGFDAAGNICLCSSQAPRLFMQRYNNRTLSYPAMTYDKYINGDRSDNESVINIVRALGIDPEKFWFLILFVTDYVDGSTQNTHKCTTTPKEEIEQLIAFVTDNEDIPSCYQRVRHKAPMKLTLQIKGRRLIINNPATISVIAAMCKELLPDIAEAELMNSAPVQPDIHDKSDSVRIWLFADLFVRFFKLYPQFTSKRKTGNSPTKSILRLISKLVYLVGLTANIDYYIDDENIKAIMKQYRGYRLDTLNNFYGGS